MWLQYGITPDGELIGIDQVGRGRLDGVVCPYCGGDLLAKKGSIKVHHFAHDGPTCAASQSDNAALPAYDNFNLHLPGRVVGELRRFAQDEDGDEDLLERHGLVTYNDYRYNGGYDLTHKGKLVLGQLSLLLFNQFQEPLLIERYQKLYEAAEQAYYTAPAIRDELKQLEPRHQALGRAVSFSKEWVEWVHLQARINQLRSDLKQLMDLPTALADLRLYTAQWRRILSTSLYFLEVKHSGGVLYKIGVTTRPIEERLAEVRANLIPYLGAVEITPLGMWPHRGNVELYFKHRYAAHQNKVGSLTEYFAFEDVKAVLRDLRRMKSKELTPLEQDILDGKPSALEIGIAREEAESRRRAAIKEGMRRAVEAGQRVGRPGVPESRAKFLAKHAAVQVALEQGLSLRQTAAATGVAINTVRKVKDLLDNSGRAGD